MGHKDWGTLGVRARHIITYSLSPYELKAFAGMFRRSPGNLLRRFFDNVFYVSPAFIIAGLVYHFGTKDFHRRQRKNPADFANDE